MENCTGARRILRREIQQAFQQHSRKTRDHGDYVVRGEKKQTIRKLELGLVGGLISMLVRSMGVSLH